MLKGLIGKKVGMTQIFDETGIAIPVTLIEAGPCVVTQVRLPEKDGYSAVQLGFEETKQKRLTSGQLGHLKRNSLPPLRFLREFRQKNPDVVEGATLKVEEVFAVGEAVDVIGTSKGKGFAGAIKRHHFSSNRESHGNSVTTRAPGSIGQNQDPGRVFPGKRMAGQYGNVTRTVQTLTVVRVDAERGLLLVKGSVPGADGGHIIVRPSVKTPAKKGA